MNKILDSVDSTNRVARDLAKEGAPHGTWIAARKQTAGRGRKNHVWDSPLGGLYVSWVIRDIPVSRWTWLPLTVAVCARQVLQQKIKSDTQVLVKWPNDLWINEKKIAGFLAESHPGAVILGAGINLYLVPESLKETSTCLKDWASSYEEPDYEALLQLLHDQLLVALKELKTSTEWVKNQYSLYTALPFESSISWEEGGQNHTGIIKELGEFGELKVQELGVWGVKSLYSETISKIRN